MRERRKHARRECFFIAADNERVPVWVFTPAEHGDDAHAGVVLDFSDTGVRVLTSSSHPLEANRYQMSLLVDAPADGVQKVECIVTRAWSEPDGSRGFLSGMHFEDNTEGAAAFIAANPPSSKDRSWIRCSLRALDPQP
jgi:hypothetical protein